MNLRFHWNLLFVAVVTTTITTITTKFGILASADDLDPAPIDFGPNALAYIGAKQTCLESTGSFPAKRCFYTYIPECAGKEAPLVFDIHGYGQSPQYISYYTGWAFQSNMECYVVVLPAGNIEYPATMSEYEACWSMPGGLKNEEGIDAYPCCCGNDKGFVDAALTDDVTFLRNVAASVVQDVVPSESSNAVSIDTKRIYMAGHSNGCISSIAMATLHSDMVAAVCCHAGIAQTSFPSTYRPTPMWIAFGTSDQVLPFEGTDSVGGFNYSFLSAHETYRVITQANGCSNLTTVDVVHSENNATRYISNNCTNGASVELLTLDHVGHIPYVWIDAAYIEEGTIPTKIDTTQLAWDFCSQYSLDMEPDLTIVTPMSDASNWLRISKTTNIYFLAFLIGVFSWSLS